MDAPEHMHSGSLTDGERAALKVEMEKFGDVATAEKVGVSRFTLARAAAGLSVRRGSVELIRRALA